MKLILDTYAHGFCNGDLDYAFINVTPSIAELFLSRIKLFRQIEAQDQTFLRTEYLDFLCFFFSAGWFEEIFEMYGIAPVCIHRAWRTDRDLPEGCEELTECQTVVIDNEGIRFTAMPKHCDYTVETFPISVELLQEIADDDFDHAIATFEGEGGLVAV